MNALYNKIQIYFLAIVWRMIYYLFSRRNAYYKLHACNKLICMMFFFCLSGIRYQRQLDAFGHRWRNVAQVRSSILDPWHGRLEINTSIFMCASLFCSHNNFNASYWYNVYGFYNFWNVFAGRPTRTVAEFLQSLSQQK